jgi:DNA adenine methylase
VAGRKSNSIDAPPKITALAPWFGSKRSLAPEIVQELGNHSSYFEPFCGSMSVLLAKPKSHHENVNDLHGDLINLARVIRDEQLGSMLYRMLRRTVLHEEIHELARRVMLERGSVGIDDPTDLERAYWYFVYSWIGRNGTAGTGNLNSGFCHRWTPHGGHGGQRFQSAISSIPAWRRRIRNATITRMDGFEFIARIQDCVSTSLYCDPPYLVKGTKYVHDFDTSDHARLAELLARFKKVRVVVSYYDHPDLEFLYPGWTRRVIEVTKSLVNQGMRDSGGAVKAREVLLINGPSYARQDSALLEGFQ